MVADGLWYALGSVLGGLLASLLTGQPLYAVPFLVFGVFCLYFFRDPDRKTPPGNHLVSPADGKIMAVKHDQSGSLTRISIFLNIFDVHVNRSPVSGTIEDVQYKTGDFLVASKELASEVNEQNTVTVRTAEGIRVTYKQIAGLIARRIVFRKEVGDFVQAGDRIGLMKFGSRMDVLFGPEWNPVVRPGDRVSAGSSILAERVAGA